MTHVALVTAVYGGYDPVRALPRQEGVDEVSALLFTDDQALARNPPPGWSGCWLPRPTMLPRLAAKCPKALPFRYLPSSVDAAIWVDGHVEVTSPTFAASLLEDLGDNEWGMFRHTHTATLRAELALSHVTGKYDDDAIEGQVATYLGAGCPDDFGIWMTGLFVRRRSDMLERFGNRWIEQMVEWSVQDQLSLPFVAWQLGIAPVDLPFEGWWSGERFMLHRHVDGSG